MSFTLTYAWWWVPAAITLVGLIWAIFIVDGGSGIGAGLANLFALVPVLLLSAVAWAVAGIMK